MGKHLEENQSGISAQHVNPGCMWGILHVLKYQRWHIKRKVRGKQNGLKNSGNDINTLKADTTSQHSNTRNSNSISTPATKGSVKSRIKALISDEFSKKKGRHRRSSTYPVRSHLTRTDSIHRSVHPVVDPFADIDLNNGSPTIVHDINASATSFLDPLVAMSSEEQNCDEYGTILTKNQVGHKQSDEMVKQIIRDCSPVKDNSDRKGQNLMHATELNTDASTRKSKEILDALNLIDVNKEFFVKILQDPGSPLAHHFSNQQAVSTKMRYSKSVSFPVASSSYGTGSVPGKLKQKQEEFGFLAKDRELHDSQTKKSVDPKSGEYIRSQSMSSIAASYRADGILKLNQAMAEIADNKLGQSQVATKHFKDLKYKLKNAIKESKKEKHRITMDAVLDKIPHGLRFSKDLQNEITERMKDHSVSKDGKDSPRSSYESDQSLPSTSKNEMCSIRRTLSLSRLQDRYCQLYESTINREGKPDGSETFQLRTEDAVSHHVSTTRSMGRNLSSPHHNSCLLHTEDSHDAHALASSQIMTVVDGNISPRSDFGKQKSLGQPISSEHLSKLDTKSLINIDIPGDLNNEKHLTIGDQLGTTSMPNIKLDAEVDLVKDDLGNLMTRNSASYDKQHIRPPPGSTTEQAEPSTVMVSVSKFQADSTSCESLLISEDAGPTPKHLPPNKLDSLEDQLAESSLDTPIVAVERIEKIEFPSENLINDILQFQVDTQDKAEFDYVRGILELSGFSGNELLGTWHSEDQPVDPSVFEEVQGCMLLDPECSGNEEGGNCYHLLLFDLINEVLMEIYAKSYTYYPMPLSSLSHIRPMPIGYRVLEEVWGHISWHLSSSSDADHLLDYVVSRDLAKSDGWMNLQFESECVGLELEDLIFDDLLEEVFCS